MIVRVAACVCCMAAVAQADTLSPADLTKDMMVAVCGTEDNKNAGNLTKTSLDASAAVRLKGVLKSLADAGIEGAASYDTTEYVNGLAGDKLAGELRSIRECNLRVYSDMSPLIKEWMAHPAAANVGSSVTQTNNGDCGVNISGSSAQNVTVNCDASN